MELHRQHKVLNRMRQADNKLRGRHQITFQIALEQVAHTCGTCVRVSVCMYLCMRVDA